MAVVDDVVRNDLGRAPLLQALERMRIEPDGAVLGFTAKLARENGWSRTFAEAVFREYKRFLYLAAVADGQVTPSDAVDQAWHLHLTYSRHYWDVLCGEIMKRPLHHGPTAGGEAEDRRYRSQYAETLALYRKVFGEEPPASVWPPVTERFSGRTLRIYAERYWLVPKSMLRGSAAAGAAALVSACSLLTAAAGGEGGADVALVALLVISALILLFAFAALRSARQKREASGDGGGGVYVTGDGSSRDKSADGTDADGGSSGGGCGGD